jgi:K+-transporting ATPase ATPase A chain
MTWLDRGIGFLVYLGLLGTTLILAQGLGYYIYRIASGNIPRGLRFLAPIERAIYRLLGVHLSVSQKWASYALSLLALTGMSILLLVFLIQGQGMVFPNLERLSLIQAFNIAISFVTNTDWQSYTPETAISAELQTIGLVVLQFLSASMGMSIALVISRSFNPLHSEGGGIGNFWVDCTRMTLYLFLPLSLFFSFILILLGVPQTLGTVAVETLEGQKQIWPLGPIATFEAIKILGTNGGGYFNASSAHAFENPNWISHVLQMMGILLIPASTVYAFGYISSYTRQAQTFIKAMSIMLTISVIISLIVASKYYLEGIELRLGHVGSLLYAVVTTATSCGSVCSAFSSFLPLEGLVLLGNMLTGSVIFGGVGSGLYQIILYTILSVFLAGLMVGRTPEFLGKKIGVFEMKMVVLAILIAPLTVLAFSALAVTWFPESPLNPGPHGLSEILYAYTSSVQNNGSSFAGAPFDLPFYNITTAITMLIGRLVLIMAVLALAGRFSSQPSLPETSGTFPTIGSLFVWLLIFVIFITNGLIFFPVLSLAPLAEYVS